LHAVAQRLGSEKVLGDGVVHRCVREVLALGVYRKAVSTPHRRRRRQGRGVPRGGSGVLTSPRATLPACTI
jgi:hypothetical protein